MYFGVTFWLTVCGGFLLVYFSTESWWWHRHSVLEERVIGLWSAFVTVVFLFANDSPLLWLPFVPRYWFTDFATVVVTYFLARSLAHEYEQNRVNLTYKGGLFRQEDNNSRLFVHETKPMKATKAMDKTMQEIGCLLDRLRLGIAPDINRVITSRSLVAVEKKILEIFQSLSNAELSLIVTTINVGTLVSNVRDRPHSWEKSTHHKHQLLQFLCIDRLAAMDEAARAAILNGMQVAGLFSHYLDASRMASYVLTHTYGRSLAVVKTLLDNTGNYHSLHRLVFHDIHPGKHRDDVLKHIEREGMAMKREYTSNISLIARKRLSGGITNHISLIRRNFRQVESMANLQVSMGQTFSQPSTQNLAGENTRPYRQDIDVSNSGIESKSATFKTERLSTRASDVPFAEDAFMSSGDDATNKTESESVSRSSSNREEYVKYGTRDIVGSDETRDGLEGLYNSFQPETLTKSEAEDENSHELQCFKDEETATNVSGSSRRSLTVFQSSAHLSLGELPMVNIRDKEYSNEHSLGMERAYKVKVLSDVDDTLLCSGGDRIAGIDRSIPAKKRYPGVLLFYRLLELGCSGAESIEWPAGRLGNLCMLSARPHIYKDTTERATYHLFENLVKSNGFYCIPSLLAGSIEGMKGMTYELNGVYMAEFEDVYRKKLQNLVELKTLYPEEMFIFVGDNGQADVKMAEAAIRMGFLSVAFIHQIQPIESTFGYSAESKYSQQIHFFTTYVQAALLAYNENLIGRLGLIEMAKLCVKETEELLLLARDKSPTFWPSRMKAKFIRKLNTHIMELDKLVGVKLPQVELADEDLILPRSNSSTFKLASLAIIGATRFVGRQILSGNNSPEPNKRKVLPSPGKKTETDKSTKKDALVHAANVDVLARDVDGPSNSHHRNTQHITTWLQSLDISSSTQKDSLNVIPLSKDSISS
eukprot:CFRG7193T1